jgi:hypothetical protein
VLDPDTIKALVADVARSRGLTPSYMSAGPKGFGITLESKRTDHLIRVGIDPGRREGDVEVTVEEEVPEEFLSWMRSPHRFTSTTSDEEFSDLLHAFIEPIMKDWTRDTRRGTDLTRWAVENPDAARRIIRRHLSR